MWKIDFTARTNSLKLSGSTSTDKHHVSCQFTMILNRFKICKCWKSTEHNKIWHCVAFCKKKTYYYKLDISHFCSQFIFLYLYYLCFFFKLFLYLIITGLTLHYSFQVPSVLEVLTNARKNDIPGIHKYSDKALEEFLIARSNFIRRVFVIYIFIKHTGNGGKSLF